MTTLFVVKKIIVKYGNILIQMYSDGKRISFILQKRSSEIHCSVFHKFTSKFSFQFLLFLRG